MSYHLVAIDLKMKGFYVVEHSITWESACIAINDCRAAKLEAGFVLMAWPTEQSFPSELRCLEK